jgi:hypothetical protein
MLNAATKRKGEEKGETEICTAVRSLNSLQKTSDHYKLFLKIMSLVLKNKEKKKKIYIYISVKFCECTNKIF